MRYQGQLVEWNDAQGFGFVLPNAGGRKIFVHLNEFRSQVRRRPVVGDLLTFEMGLDANKRSCAVKVAPVMASHERVLAKARQDEREARATGSLVSLVLALVWVVAVVIYALTARVPWTFLAVWGGINLVTFVMYAADKSAAAAGRWRTPEARLHMLALIGGWPAAAFAQRVFRHKTSKAEFRFMFWLTVFVNCAAMVWFSSRVAA